MRDNAVLLLEKVNGLLRDVRFLDPGLEAAQLPKITSGWRPAAYNATIPGAALRSRHITGEAVDLADPAGELDQFLFDNQGLLAAHGCFMEHPLATKNWTHLQSVMPRSGNIVFIP